MKWVIRDARLIDPSQGLDGPGDLVIEGDRVLGIERPGAAKATQVLSLPGCWIVPGLIDLHVHLREPGQRAKETLATGLEAALRGGFTSVACMANTHPVNDRPEITRWILAESARASKVRVYCIGAVSLGLAGTHLTPMVSQVSAGVRAFSDDGRPVMNSRLMRQALEQAAALGVCVISHAEDLYLSEDTDMHEGEVSWELGMRGNPGASEEIMVSREMALCRLTRAHMHIAHVSTASAVELIRRAKAEGLRVTAEVTPHHLAFTDAHCRDLDTDCKMAPPLRTDADREACLAGLADGTLDCIASDHAPHAESDKAVPWPEASCGVVGLETVVGSTLQWVHEGRITASRWVESLSTKPAQILGVAGGSLKPGSIADLTCIEPSLPWKYSTAEGASLGRNSPFEGKSFKGRATRVWISGQEVPR